MQLLSHIGDWWIRDGVLNPPSLAEAFSVAAAVLAVMMVHCHHLVDFQL